MSNRQTTYDSTTADSWQINADQDGPKVVDEGLGVMGVRDYLGALAKLLIADPTLPGHAITRQWGEANLGNLLPKSITTNLSVPAGYTRLAHRPSIADGVTVDVANGGTWKVL